jgi:hypothetical protein
VQIVGPGGFEYAGDERLLAGFGGKPHKLYRTNKVSTVWIRVFDDEFGELELAFEAQSLLRDTANDWPALSRHALGGGVGAMCVYGRGARIRARAAVGSRDGRTAAGERVGGVRQSGRGYDASAPRLRSFLPGGLLFVTEEVPVVVRLLRVSRWRVGVDVPVPLTEWKGSVSESQP